MEKSLQCALSFPYTDFSKNLYKRYISFEKTNRKHENKTIDMRI